MKTDKIRAIIKSRYAKYGAILVVGVLLGWMIFGGGKQTQNETTEHNHQSDVGQVWTCAMHPQIKQDKPGKCPLCGMDLIPLKTADSGDEMIDVDAIQMSKEAIALANIQTTVVSRKNPTKSVRLYGTIQADERLSQSQASHVGGRIERLLVGSVGETVRQGEAIATIYSPELLNAQQELLEAIKMEDVSPTILHAARERLRLLKLSDEMIERFEKSAKVSPIVEIRANTSGVVVDKRVNQGDYVDQGSVMFDIANLSRVWVVFDAYEVDLPFLKVGDKIDYTIQALPGRTFSGKIAFINPILDQSTRTTKVRVEVANHEMQFKPGMYVNAVVEARLREHNNGIVIPKSAVLWTGKRSIVYVKQTSGGAPAFKLHEIELGPSLGESYVVISGINDEDEIVTNGAFAIDATAQLEGKPSMMNPKVAHAVVEHQGHEGREVASIHKTSLKGEHAMIDVQGACEMCKERIETAARTINGVISASWDLKSKKLHLELDPAKTTIDAVSNAIAKAGHDTDKHKADKATYDALPGCCQYRK